MTKAPLQFNGKRMVFSTNSTKLIGYSDWGEEAVKNREESERSHNLTQCLASRNLLKSNPVMD